MDLLKKKVFLRRAILSEEDVPLESIDLKLSEEKNGSSEEKMSLQISREFIELVFLKKIINLLKKTYQFWIF